MKGNEVDIDLNKGNMFVKDPIKAVKDQILNYISNYVFQYKEIEPDTLLGFIKVLNELEKDE